MYILSYTQGHTPIAQIFPMFLNAQTTTSPSSNIPTLGTVIRAMSTSGERQNGVARTASGERQNGVARTASAERQTDGGVRYVVSRTPSEVERERADEPGILENLFMVVADAVTVQDAGMCPDYTCIHTYVHTKMRSWNHMRDNSQPFDVLHGSL
jgi:hypothetical protein